MTLAYSSNFANLRRQILPERFKLSENLISRWNKFSVNFYVRKVDNLTWAHFANFDILLLLWNWFTFIFPILAKPKVPHSIVGYPTTVEAELIHIYMRESWMWWISPHNAVERMLIIYVNTSKDTENVACNTRNIKIWTK